MGSLAVWQWALRVSGNEVVTLLTRLCGLNGRATNECGGGRVKLWIFSRRLLRDVTLQEKVELGDMAIRAWVLHVQDCE